MGGSTPPGFIGISGTDILTFLDDDEEASQGRSLAPVSLAARRTARPHPRTSALSAFSLLCLLSSTYLAVNAPGRLCHEALDPWGLDSTLFWCLTLRLLFVFCRVY